MDDSTHRPYRGARHALRCLLLPTISAMLVLVVQVLTGYPIRLSVPLEPGRILSKSGRGVEFALPDRITHPKNAADRFVGEVSEDGVVLDGRGKSLRMVQEEGMGRFWIRGNKLWLSSGDGSDPAANGKRYAIRAAWRPDAMPWVATGGLLLAVVAGLLAAGNPGHSPARRFLEEAKWLVRATGCGKVREFCRQGNRSRRMAVILLAGLAGFRFFAMAAEEIWASPFDPWGYATMAIYPGIVGTHPPGASWVFRYLFTEFGVPARIGFEALYCGAAALFSLAIGRAMRSRAALLLSFALFALFPALQVFRNFSVEPMMVFCLTAASACLGLAYSDGRAWKNPFLWLAGLIFGIWQISRAELPLVAATALACAGVFALFRANPLGHGWQAFFKAACAGAIPLLCVLGAHLACTAFYAQRHGVAAKSMIELPGGNALLSALYAIEAPDTFRYAPVTRKTLEMACAASPALQAKSHVLLDPLADATLAGQKVTGKPGEPGPWLNILVWQAFCQIDDTQAGQADSASPGGGKLSEWKRIDTEMAVAAEELRAAMARGALPHRPSFFPLDPEFGRWVPGLPETFRRACMCLARIPPYSPINDALQFGTHATMDTYRSGPAADCDAAALRRRALLGHDKLDLEVQLEGDTAGISAAALAYRGRVFAAAVPESSFASLVPLAKPPVKPGLASGAGGNPPPPSGPVFLFRTYELPRPPADPSQLVLATAAGPVAAMDVLDLRDGSRGFTRSDTGGQVRVVVREFTKWNPARIFKDRAELLEQLPGAFRGWLGFAAGGFFVLGLVMGRDRRGAVARALGFTTCIVMAVLGLRLCFYTIVEANLSWGFERYIEPYAPLFYATLATLPAFAGMLARLLWERLPTGRTASLA